MGSFFRGSIATPASWVTWDLSLGMKHALARAKHALNETATIDLLWQIFFTKKIGEPIRDFRPLAQPSSHSISPRCARQDNFF